MQQRLNVEDNEFVKRARVGAFVTVDEPKIDEEFAGESVCPEPDWEIIEQGRQNNVQNIDRFGVFELRLVSETVDCRVGDGESFDFWRAEVWRCRLVGRE